MANTEPQPVDHIATVVDIRETALPDGLNKEEKRLQEYKKDEPIDKASMGDYVVRCYSSCLVEFHNY
jgi:hypothetical protein